MIEKRNKPTAVAVGGSVGGALGTLSVVFIPKLIPEWQWTPEEAAMTTAALGIVFGFFIRYLPEPKK